MPSVLSMPTPARATENMPASGPPTVRLATMATATVTTGSTALFMPTANPSIIRVAVVLPASAMPWVGLRV